VKEKTMSIEPAAAPARTLEDEKRVAHVLYILHLLAPFTAWLLAAVAVILGAYNRADVRGTFLESHFSWLSRTFWWGLLWIVVFGLVSVLLVITVILIPLAYLLYLGLFVWYLYRVVKGWIRLNKGQPIA
jgi:uncharacterized membrane protein